MDRLLRIGAFAELAGVSVRTLHHYDQIGLLRPVRTAAGYRVYGRRELERLEQIVALRFVGVPLAEMAPLLNGHGLAAALGRQRALLEEKRSRLEDAIRAIAAAEATMARGEQPDTAILTQIIEVMEMEKNANWTEKYYTPEAHAALAERRSEWTPEKQRVAEQQWLDLFRDVEAALDKDPAGVEAQALGARWKTLVGAFTGGNAAVGEGLNRLYADRPNWPQQAREQMAAFSNARVWEFMGRVLNCKSMR